MELLLLSVIALALTFIIVGDYHMHFLPQAWVKKIHYKRSRISVLRNLWDIEFKRGACEAAREAERLVFDRLSEQVAAYNVRIEKLKDRGGADDASEIKQCMDKIQELLDARKMHQDQMDALDEQKKQLQKNVDDLRSVVTMLEDAITKQ